MTRPRCTAPGLALLLLAAAPWLAGCDRTSLPTESAVEETAASAAQNADAPAWVNGGGTAALTDILAQEFTARFAISGKLLPDGTASGSINFVFGPEFSAFWAVVPGVQNIHVKGKVSYMEVTAAGAVILGGNDATEREVVRGGKNVVFRNEPFEVVVTGPGVFTFWWCEVPSMDFRVTNGQLQYGTSGLAATTANVVSGDPTSTAGVESAAAAVIQPTSRCRRGSR